MKLVDPANNKRKTLTIGDNEFGGAALDFLGLALLVDPVRFLVVDEQLGGALAAHPLVEHGLVGRLFEGLLRTRTYEIQIRGRFGYVSRDCATFAEVLADDQRNEITNMNKKLLANGKF